jgi:hypothetical protein
MQARRLWDRLASAFAIVAILSAGSPAVAGTTGQMLGVVTDPTGTPIVAAKVTAASPSGIVTATTDASGHFAMLDLVPDTYVVTFETPAYQSAVVSRVTITADGSRTIDEKLSHLTDAHTTLLFANSGSSAYSIDAVTQFKTSLADGGGFANSAYSALSTVPGVFIAPDQNGYDPSISIRGGGFDEVAYGIDGIPVNRPYDNAPGGPASSLGQQELQVYTGSAPADSAVQGLSGVVNQVIRVGTLPGYTSLEETLGGPGFLHQIQAETAGATTNRNFSYYVGIGGYDQTFRFADNFGGLGVSQLYGVPLSLCVGFTAAQAPSCYVHGAAAGTGVNAVNTFYGSGANAYLLGPANLFATSQVNDRNSVVNLHLAIPRKNGLHDDVSFLGMIDYVKTYLDSSANDIGSPAYILSLQALYGFNAPSYIDGLAFNAPTGEFLPSNYRQLTTNYYYPNSPSNRAPFATIEPGLEDSQTNNQSIAKIQYTHPFSQNALLRLYGYTDYGGEYGDTPNEELAEYFTFPPLGPDLMTVNHSRGFGASFVDQLGPANQLRVAASFATSTTYHQTNYEFDDNFEGSATFAYVVDSKNPTDGLCYPVTGGAAVSCYGPRAGVATLAQAYQGQIQPASGTCGGGPCKYLVTYNGPSGPTNSVSPTSLTASISDDFQPTRNLSFEGGLRIDDFRDEGAVTNDGNVAQAFYYSLFNLTRCIDAQGQLVPRASGAPCPPGTTSADFQNPPGRFTQSHTEFEPHLQASYSVGGDTTLRASYARVSQPSPVQPLQSQGLNLNTPAFANTANGIFPFGSTTPNRVLPPPTSNTYDVSIEHVFGRDLSFRLTPFYRTTQNQLLGLYPPGYNIALNSNMAQQTSRGVEFEFDKGRFDRDGLAARLTATYTNSFIRYLDYNQYGDGLIDPINANIAQYNAYTAACAAGGKLAGKTQYGTPVCGSTVTGAPASPCYTPTTFAADGTFTSGVAEPCSVAGAVGNPYWNAPAQSLVDPKGDFPTYQTVGGYPGLNTTSYDAPYVASLTLNYKHGPFAVTPLLTLEAGQRYGAPGTTYGVSPDLCSGLAGAVPNDPRYPYGSPGGVGFDATSAASQVACSPGFLIPNPYSRKFDAFGAFSEPSIAQLQIQISYDVSKNLQLVAAFANVVSDCFGGSQEPWNVKGACSYTPPSNAAQGSSDIGNQYNPGAVIQPYLNTPYLPNFAPAPFGFGISAKIKL